jgi:F-type H+-transporting ATPase subunit gamma
MSQSHDLQLHITQMQEIRAILNSMKNMALMEIHKLARYQTMQGQAVANIEDAAMDFLDFYPRLFEDDYATHIGILVGSERGFCGDFNESLMNAVSAGTYAAIIVIGDRLGTRLSPNLPVNTVIAGASVAEEVPDVLNRLINTINALAETDSPVTASRPEIRLTAVYHDNVSNRINQRQILPPFPSPQQQKPHYGHPPLLNLDAGEFYSDLIHHYLFAVLHEIFYISLMAENHSRLQHLEGAVKHLDDDTVNLNRKLQMYRQEEITEEIEVILLNSENP